MRPQLFLLLILLLAVSCKDKSSDRFVEIQGHPQHILDMGKGKPVAVFVAGLGDDLTTFAKIQSEISKITRTLSYDRAGLGKSEKLNNVRTVDNMAIELHERRETPN